MKYYAHSTDRTDKSDWQPLAEHLKNVAERAAKCASPFGGEEWAYLAGLYHDVGKGRKVWQAYLRRVNSITDEFAPFYAGHPNHALVGAQVLFSKNQQAGKLLAYLIAGHHGGLSDWDGSQNAGLRDKLDDDAPDVDIPLDPLNFPNNLCIRCDQDRLGFQIQFFARMLFSCLVDADYLDTEKFLDSSRSKQRGRYPGIKELHERFWNNFTVLREKADHSLPVNVQRERVLVDCLRAADKQPGIFSLTVPTGGGKTLSSLAFAVNHARKHGKRRIIYVIPFTSIIEQNAGVFRAMLGDDAVLEHHCNYIPYESDWKTRLAVENWDAPVVVTTNVQFFDSLFANRTSKCRKLHNIADSIVIFDEVQAIPVEKLKPCLEVIRELTQNYGVTAVLCTATQPAIEHNEQFPGGLKVDQEIVKDVTGLYAALKRTEELFIGKLNEFEVAERLMEHEQVLCIVNTRQQALDIFNALPVSNENIHLSALMYPAHRTEKLTEIRRRLSDSASAPCRVVSTQLIEAGVDVDFPCVYRAVAGIDSIAQAAGRCNRNGRSNKAAKVYVFDFPEEGGCSYFRQAAQSAVKLFDEFAGELTSPACVRKYFADYFWKNEQRMDEDGILEKCLTAQGGDIQFREIAGFQMIRTATIPVVIAIDEKPRNLVQSLKFSEHKGSILRHLQQFTVQIYPYQFDEIRDWLDEPVPGIWVLHTTELYSESTGLQCTSPQGAAFFG